MLGKGQRHDTLVRLGHLDVSERNIDAWPRLNFARMVTVPKRCQFRPDRIGHLPWYDRATTTRILDQVRVNSRPRGRDPKARLALAEVMVAKRFRIFPLRIVAPEGICPQDMKEREFPAELASLPVLVHRRAYSDDDVAIDKPRPRG